MKIEKRKLSPEEAEIISKAMRLTNNIMGYTAKELASFENTFVASNGKEMIGIFTYVELENWIDLKIFIILKEYRGKGYGREFFDYAFKQMRGLNKSIYTVTRTPIVMRLLKEKGFAATNLFRLPVLVCCTKQR